MPRRRIRIISAAVAAVAFLAIAAPAAQAAPPLAGRLQLIDVASVPGVASTSSEYDGAADVTDDGRYVVFASNAQDLFTPVEASWETNEQLYLRDTVLNTTTQINANAGDPSGNYAIEPSISDDGMLVAYLSATPVPSAGVVWQAYVWSAITRLSTLVSTSYETPTHGVNSGVVDVEISGSGNAIVYSTTATDVLPGDPYVVARSRVYKVDATTGDTTLVEYDPTISASAPAISADGRYVGFISSDDHTAVSAGGVDQGYVRDSLTGITELISVDAGGTRAGNAPTTAVSLSVDAHAVAFASSATNLPDSVPGSDSHVYVRDRAAGSTMITGKDFMNQVIAADEPVLSASGRVLVFAGVSAGVRQIFMRDLGTGRGRLISQSSTAAGAETSQSPALSGNGVYTVWSSTSENLTSDRYPYSHLHDAHHYFLANLGTR